MPLVTSTYKQATWESASKTPHQVSPAAVATRVPNLSVLGALPVLERLRPLVAPLLSSSPVHQALSPLVGVLLAAPRAVIVLTCVRECKGKRFECSSVGQVGRAKLVWIE